MADISVGGILGDFVTLQRGTTYKSKLLGTEGPWLLGLACITRNGGFKSDNLKTYGGPSDEKILVEPGDVLVSLKDVTQAADLLGAVVKVPAQIARGRLTQDTVKLNFAGSAQVRDYIYWLLRTPQARSHCRRHATGTTNLGLAREDFLAIEVPPLDTDREKLLSLLNDLDDKIELNRRMNETLEAMARVLFRDWFVDFGPVKAKMAGTAPYLAPDLWSLFPDRLDDNGVPEGWSMGKLNFIARCRADKADPEDVDNDTPYIGLEHMPRRSIALNDWETAEKVTSGKSRFSRGDVLFGKLRPYFHKVGVAPVDGICSTDIVVLQPQMERLAAFLIACVSTDEFVAFTDQSSTGTKMPRTSWKIMREYEISIAPNEILDGFEALAGPMIDRVLANIEESRTLAQTRDLLLPKLMSGEIRVGNS